MMHLPRIQNPIQPEDYKKIARALTLVENDLDGAEDILHHLNLNSSAAIIGITGPPGAGKSTLVNALINSLSEENKLIAVLAVDPTSPFNLGSLLGDRIRMMEQFNKPNVYIRSVATRGSLGGLSAKIIEMVDVLRSCGFDYIIVETVGVGQSEVEIVGLADITIVVMVPESGDEIQSIKSGLMEIADIFVVNKADREGADTFANNLKKLVHQKATEIPVLKTIADKSEGISELLLAIKNYSRKALSLKPFLLTEKAWRLIQQKKMQHIDKKKLQQNIAEASELKNFNLYRFVNNYIESDL
ncbi:methylmalonyl Co-A mutase-associated GTPase MeaB [Daejeonella oryzae]|uniref:methylmalonyl Co-A mutase-associated GTPase MeaB n=1 Tax=Daejeonella oryzae TaxID=1122943 RepID=UPI001FDED744|nr:methylmalonyl Co-A mutase-associated GTPase MeaB [Daejeonella oryzae]